MPVLNWLPPAPAPAKKEKGEALPERAWAGSIAGNRKYSEITKAAETMRMRISKVRKIQRAIQAARVKKKSRSKLLRDFIIIREKLFYLFKVNIGHFLVAFLFLVSFLAVTSGVLVGSLLVHGIIHILACSLPCAVKRGS